MKDMTGPEPRKKVPPFSRAKLARVEPQFDISPFTPQQGAAEDLVPATGIDLSGRPKIVFAAGRGKTGKTTFLRWMAEQSAAEGRPFLMADIDPTNASFASYFPEVARPDTDEPSGVCSWLQEFIEYAVEHKSSALIDLGGGDTTLRSIAAEMPDFADQIEASGVSPVIFYMVGAQAEDLAPVATLTARQFKPAARAIIINEHSGETGLDRVQAFSHIVRSRIFIEQRSGGTLGLWMPRLHAATAVETRRCTFAAARDGQTNPPLGLFDRARVRLWLQAMEHQFQGVRSWMP